jgi:hypothetical protein
MTRKVVATTAATAVLILAASASGQAAPAIQVHVQPRVVEYRPSRVSVTGIVATEVSVRLRGADDPTGPAYRWTAYRWHPLRLVRGSWHGVLPAPPLRGIYQLQFRVQQSKRLIESPRWLLRVMTPGTLRRTAFRTPRAVVDDYVRDLPGDQVLVAARPWPQAGYDHRDPRLNRTFVIAYAPRGDNRVGSRLGVFITTVRDGYHGRWRLLETTTGPPD